jgi:hypothetical protein
MRHIAFDKNVTGDQLNRLQDAIDEAIDRAIKQAVRDVLSRIKPGENITIVNKPDGTIEISSV